MPDALLTELTERYEYGRNAWQDIRKEGATDMQFVAGDPWDANDKEQRKNRPTIAPEEMGQYFNQVINHLWSNPRGMQFAPVGRGASEKGARFYQNKAREIEYRSHAKIAYTTAAADAIQRSYGYVRLLTKHASPYTSNQEIWIEAVPDPDMVEPDYDAKRPDSSDMQYCFVKEWRDQKEFKRQFRKAKVTNFGEWTTRQPSWVSGDKILIAEYWAISTRPRTLLLVQPMAPEGQQRLVTPGPQQQPMPVEVFEDEIPQGARVLRELRKVDYPKVKMYLTNGLEILHEQDWAGKYIPIVSCYGKVLYVPTGGETKRVMLSMTRFGRAPWKAYCYAASQELEVLSMVPKAPFLVPKGTFAGPLGIAVQESMHQPKAFLEYDDQPNGQGGNRNPPPQHADYPAGQHLQALEIVKEGFRRSIQSAMGSNFLPTEALKRNQKSGVALERIEQAASTGTFHFVNNYEDMIRQVGVIIEDLIEQVHDFSGETGIMEADGTAKSVAINDGGEESFDTKGDHLVTVSTGPSSDSEREAVQEFTDSIVSNLPVIAQVAGSKAAAAVLARSIRLRNGGPELDQLADILEPAEYKAKEDGEKPPSPEVIALKGEIEQLKGVLQEAAQEKEAKTVEQQGKLAIVQTQEQAETQRERESLAVTAQIAEVNAILKRMELMLKASEGQKDRAHDVGLAQADAAHEQQMADQQQEHDAEMARRGVVGQMAVQANNPPNGASA